MARNLRLYRTLENKHTKDITQCQTNRKFKTYNTIPCKIKLYIYIYIYIPLHYFIGKIFALLACKPFAHQFKNE